MADRHWLTVVSGCLLLGCAAVGQQEADGPGRWSWQQSHAEVDARGDLRWRPEPYQFDPLPGARYIDYEAGDDEQDGSRERPWRHHPWDPAATGRAAGWAGPHHYLFMGGVVYRGALRLPATLSAGETVVLASDPTWGEGEAVICGADLVTGWQRGAVHPDVPEPEQVWHATLDYLPRNVWVTAADGTVTRLALARTPNWTVSDPDDIKSEWWHWDMPGKPFDVYTTNERGGQLHVGVDSVNLTGPAAMYQDAIVWTEYGWVMGTPYPARVEVVDIANRSLGFGGQWGGAGSKKIVRFNRYYLEDKPHYLDAPGEFWFERQGNGGRLYVRLPDDQDPTTVRVEAGRRLNLIEGTAARNLRIAGLTFRFTNVIWDLTAGPWVGEDVEPACIRVLGSGDNIQIDHCRFEHIHRAVRLKVADGGEFDRVRISDNVVLSADHAAFEVSDAGDWGVRLPAGRLRDVQIMRNSLELIGLRPSRYGQGHAVEVRCAETLEVAGNILDRLYGSGIFVYGAKQNNALVDRPFSRILIHHNKVTDSLLNSNDWGGIETWQGGPAYVYNNISGNPGGYWHYNYMLNPERPGRGRFGHAYYLDGAFKNYYFNNIAWGKSSDPLDRLGNTSAFQEIHSYQNTFFNNTVHRFVIGSRRQAPQAGRNKFLGNVWQDIGQMLFRHADPARSAAEANAADAGEQKSTFDYATNAYAANVTHGIAAYGVFEETGRVWTTAEEFIAALLNRRSLVSSLGVEVAAAPLPSAEEHDFRPAAGFVGAGRGVTCFVPWSLYATVGEWHFLQSPDPARVEDEHWYMTPYHVERGEYHQRPMYPLEAVAVTAEDYEPGPLDNWVPGALRLNGRDQYARLANERLTEPFSYQVQYTAPAWAEVTAPRQARPGQPITIEVKLLTVDTSQQIHLDLHYQRADGSFGGMNRYGGASRPVTGPGPYTFRLTPAEQPDLGSFTATVYLSPSGEWQDHTVVGRATIGLGDDATSTTTALGGGPVDETRTAAGPDLRNPQVHHSSVLIEACFRAEPQAGEAVLVEKLADAGYSLTLGADGSLTFALAAAGRRAEVVGGEGLHDGSWRHVIAEADRSAARLNLYLDGRLIASAPGLTADVTLANDADLHVGGTATGRCLAGAVEFVRICLGTLVDSRTSIDELYAWQFGGPQFADFTGARPADGQRDAGAIDVR